MFAYTAHPSMNSYALSLLYWTISRPSTQPLWIRTQLVAARIAPDKNAPLTAAREARQYEKTSFYIFSGGSGYEGGIGAAAQAKTKDGATHTHRL